MLGVEQSESRLEVAVRDARFRLPRQIIENGDSGVLKRANMLCTGCGSCAIACPFGTVYTDLILFPSSVCDLCKDRLSPGEKQLCVTTCGYNSIDYKEVDIKKEGDLVEVFEDIVVKVAGGQLWEPFLREEEKEKAKK